MRKAKQPKLPPEFTVQDLLEWHKNEQFSYSAFGTKIEMHKFHEGCVNLLYRTIHAQAAMAKALVYLPAYQTHEAELFYNSHDDALKAAKKIHPAPCPSVPILEVAQ